MQFITQSGAPVGPVGQGTWYLGENPGTFDRECAALRAGVEAGMNLIDTAEMYGEGLAETMIGAAIQGLDREKLYLVSKVYPHNAGRDNIFRCCENSLRRMRTDYMDLYLLHWRGTIPLTETVTCMEELKVRGLIRAWGVSNFDRDWMEKLAAVENGTHAATDQVLYHLGSRGIEYDLLPYLQEREIPVMAYCPMAQAGQLRQGLLESEAVCSAASAHGAAPSQILLSFLLSRKGVLPIPRASRPEHAVENAAAAQIRLSPEELSALDHAFPAPQKKTKLDVV